MNLFGLFKSQVKKPIVFSAAQEADAISLSLRKGGEGPERMVDKHNMQLTTADTEKALKPEQLYKEITPG